MKRLIVYPLASLLLTVAGGEATAEEPQKSKEEILSSVVQAELTRAWPVKRKGFVFEEASRSYGEPSRSLRMVEDVVRVDAETNISLPITFEINSSSALAGRSAQQLRTLAEALRERSQGDRFLIEGHTCVKGSSDLNNRLSIARANFVIDFLVRQGIPGDVLQGLGQGPAEALKDELSSSDAESVLAPYRKVKVHRIAQ